MKSSLAIFVLCLVFLCGCGKDKIAENKTSEKKDSVTTINKNVSGSEKAGNPYYSKTDTTKLNVTDAEWKKILPDSIYQVGRGKATEEAFKGKYTNSTGKGTYYCAVCGNELFRSDSKFSSTCGWPSFFETRRTTSVIYQEDHSAGMERMEVLCGRCGSHLGHLFDDGPPPTFKRYCMNSIVLDFVADNEVKTTNTKK